MTSSSSSSTTPLAKRLRTEGRRGDPAPFVVVVEQSSASERIETPHTMGMPRPRPRSDEMKNVLWFLVGVISGFVFAHFVNKDPRRP